ncbi:MAG: acetyltransferase [Deltaproteobacteria bacterium]|nr:acetyltransferase [Deltaproteobacteria bacterium]MBW2698220.1 acetyltransferase [Deltaproteobacteria bacterium]
MRRVAIIGGGGHGREQLDLLAALNRRARSYEYVGFVVDPEYASQGSTIRDLPVLGGMEWIASHRDDVEFICAVGDSADRLAVAGRATAEGARFLSLVHPSVEMSESVELGIGVILSAGVVLTSDIVLGDHVHINIGSTISHDCRLADYVSIAPGGHLSGFVNLAEGTQLGTGTVVRDRRSIGEWSISGAGAVIADDIPANTTVLGVPAKVIRTRPAGWQHSP